MKKKISLLMAAVMAFSTLMVMPVSGSSTNIINEELKGIRQNEILVSNVPDRSVGIIDSALDTIASGTPVNLQIRPHGEIDMGDEIFLMVENGQFDERLVNADPFIFRTEVTGTTYDTIANDTRDSSEVLTDYVGNEGSRKLPYGFQYINNTTIKVKLYPITDQYVNNNNNSVTKGVPYYNIALPITTKDVNEGNNMLITVDSNKTAISSGTYEAAYVGEYVKPNYEHTQNTLSVKGSKITKDSVLLVGAVDKSLSILNDTEAIKAINAANTVSLNIQPGFEIQEGTSILLNIKNGKFNKNLAENPPYSFRTRFSGCTYADIVADGRDTNTVLTAYIGNENSRKLPYDMKYISDSQLSVTFYPIGADKVNNNNSDVTKGIPYYSIPLPVTTEGSAEGDVVVSIDDLGSDITKGDYVVATVTSSPDVIDVSPTSNSSTNSIGAVDCRVQKDSNVLTKDNSPVTLKITPKFEITKDSSIILIAENGKFDESLAKSEPYIYKSEIIGVTYDDIMRDGRHNSDVLIDYVGNTNSRKLPYGFRYISPEMLEVYLYPIEDTYVNKNNNDVTKGIPYYNIALPLTTKGSVDGSVKVGIYNNSTPVSGGSYVVATVGNGAYEGKTNLSSVTLSNMKLSRRNNRVVTSQGKITPEMIGSTDVRDEFNILSARPLSIQIRPRFEVKRNSKAVITIDNGKFDPRLMAYDNFKFTTEVSNVGYETIAADGRDINTVLTSYIGNEYSRKLPYDAKIISDNKMEITFYPIGDDKVNQNNSDVTKGTPYYNIALPIVTTKTGDINATIKGDFINPCTLGVATIYDKGVAEASVNKGDLEKLSGTTHKIPDITIKEMVPDTFESQKVTVILNRGFKWVPGGKIRGYLNCYDYEGAVENIKIDGSKLEFNFVKGAFPADRVSSVLISDFLVECDGRNDIKVEIKGDGITDATLVLSKPTEPSTVITTEVTTESTTESGSEATTSEAGSETTTKGQSSSGGHSGSSGGGGGGGGGSSAKKTTTTTTTTTTEATTEATTAVEKSSETTTEAPETQVKVAIGSSVITVDDKDYNIDAAPYIQSASSSTLVPLRFVAVALGGGNIDSADTSDMIKWDPLTKSATIVKDDTTIVFKAGSNIATLNNRNVAMDYGVVAEIKDSRMYVPFRFIGESLGYEVSWIGTDKTAIYTIK